MQTLAGGNTIAGVAGTALAITCTILGAEVTTGTPTYKVLAQSQLAASAATVYTVPSAPATALIKSIHLANVTGSDVTGVALFINGTADANRVTGALTIPANGMAIYDADGWRIHDAAGGIKTTGDAGPTGAQGATGSTGPAVFLVGERGRAGADGAPGRDGATGAQGTTGDTGSVGPAVFFAAPRGKAGADGPPGQRGADGAPGSPGSPGSAGATGPAVLFVADRKPPEPMMIPGPAGPAGQAGGGDITKISGSSGAAGASMTWQVLTADAATNSTTTFAAVMTTTGVGAGWYSYQYFVVTQSGATTTGQKFRVVHSGTVGNAGALMEWPATATTASNDVLAAGADATSNRLMQHNTAVATGTDLGPMTDVQALNADALITITGYIEVTATGTLTLEHASEVAAASTVQAGTNMVLRKIT